MNRSEILNVAQFGSTSAAQNAFVPYTLKDGIVVDEKKGTRGVWQLNSLLQSFFRHRRQGLSTESLKKFFRPLGSISHFGEYWSYRLVVLAGDSLGNIIEGNDATKIFALMISLGSAARSFHPPSSLLRRPVERFVTLISGRVSIVAEA